MSDSAVRPLRVAIIGAGPAGVYAADILTKAEREFEVSIDLLDAYPAPYGLIRYGVAPDHPRIKGIVNALHKVLDRGDIRFLGNVTYGRDLTLSDIRDMYDAVIFATGAIKDAGMDIPGIELEGSFGAADFVSWYDGQPDVPRDWPLEAKEIAVIGNGNVALDVARVLSKHAEDLLVTEIPDNVFAGLKDSPVTDVHIFGRRGPAQVKFTPLELRELSHSRDVDIVLYPEDFEFDEASDALIKSNNQVKTMVNTLTNWIVEEQDTGASRRLHLHFLHSPVEITGAGRQGRRHQVRAPGTRRHRQRPGHRRIHRLPGPGRLPRHRLLRFRAGRARIRCHAAASSPTRAAACWMPTAPTCPGLYATGWIKRGPVGLIGHTKGDALETIGNLLEDRLSLPRGQRARTRTRSSSCSNPAACEYTTWEGWKKLDAHEISLGAAATPTQTSNGPVDRARVKVVEREEMVKISRG